MEVDVSAVSAVFTALSPILTWVAPLVKMSLSLSFIRSFFD